MVGTLELRELYSKGNISANDVPKPETYDNPSEEDMKFMKLAKKTADKSPDDHTKVSTASYSIAFHLVIVKPKCILLLITHQVGAVIVDHSGKKVIGEGWNRMPFGCEKKFGWNRDCSGGILETKYPYGEFFSC